MTASSIAVTLTDLIAASSNVLEAGGYQRIQSGVPEWDTPSTRLFEDKYSIVGIAVFATTAELLNSWADLQGALVDLISRHVGQAESKAWDGYLVLMTTGIAPSSDAAIEELRYDMTRLRKLVATGEDLSTASDVEGLLRQLLPLRTAPGSLTQGTALDLLPGLLEEQGIDAKTTAVLVQAFSEQQPLMDSLHRTRGTNETVIS
jgi:hypothetical protein